MFLLVLKHLDIFLNIKDYKTFFITFKKWVKMSSILGNQNVHIIQNWTFRCNFQGDLIGSLKCVNFQLRLKLNPYAPGSYIFVTKRPSTLIFITSDWQNFPLVLPKLIKGKFHAHFLWKFGEKSYLSKKLHLCYKLAPP